MNYKRLYESIINKAQTEWNWDLSERHHIVPKSLGGTDSESNLVWVSFRQHYVLHLLLYKIYGGSQIFAVERFYDCNRLQSRSIKTMPRWIRRRLTIEKHRFRTNH